METTSVYEPSSTMRQARDEYFERNGFGEDGGYNDAWVDFKVGPVPCPFPNTKSRIRAVAVHDLHHILTGYKTDFTGELEISAWELGAGCKDFAAAWFLNLGGLSAGLLVAPKRVFRAFVRGRNTQSLYGRELDQLLDTTVADMRRETNADAPPADATLDDKLRFAAASVVGSIVGLVSLGIGVFVVPLGLATHFLRRKTAVSHQPSAVSISESQS